MKFRKKPVVIDATQWFKNGDHPDDTNLIANAGAGEPYIQAEGKVVRYYRRPDMDGENICVQCERRMHDHGFIDTWEGGHIVCPGDWVITGVKGERYPCKPHVFAATYERVEGLAQIDADLKLERATVRELAHELELERQRQA